jgi:hypothetical protein
MRLVKIYALLNPIDHNVFYVGATTSELKIRLSAHCSRYCYIDNRPTFGKKKADYIYNLKEYNAVPEIMLLEEVNFEDVDRTEEFYYFLFKSYGFTLIQDSKAFNYTKKSGNIYYK